MYLQMECEVCKVPRYQCDCTKEQLMKQSGRVEYHTYAVEGREAVVFKYDDGTWGCDYYETQEDKSVFIASEKYEGHSEEYAESAADNYCFRVKNFENNQTS